MAHATNVALAARSSALASTGVTLLPYAFAPNNAVPPPMVAVVYDAQTRQIAQTVIPATVPPKLYPHERCVMVPLGFYQAFHSQEDLYQAIPQIAPYYDSN